MYSAIHSGLLAGLELIPIRTEVNISAGLPSFSIVGLPTNAVSESRTRVKAALKEQGYEFPSRKVVVNLAPADIKKETALFDLPIALGVVCAQHSHMADKLKGIMCFGELSLDGRLSSSHLTLPLTLAAKRDGYREVFINAADAPQAALISGIKVRGFESVGEIIRHLRGTHLQTLSQPVAPSTKRETDLNFDQIVGLNSAKRALTIAAIGQHNIRLSGPPGCGKSMLGSRLHTILPDLSTEQALELASMEGQRSNRCTMTELNVVAPSRSPHYSITTPGLIGGGANPRPGEISLAHHGVLFLDEFLEFRRQQLEALRTPIEEGCVRLSRCEHFARYPAKFILAAAHNPCPCGYYGSNTTSCRCSSRELRTYQNKLSGPLNDRFDIHIRVREEVPSIGGESHVGQDSSSDMRRRVTESRRFHESEAVLQGRKLTPRAVTQLTRIGGSGNYSFRRRARLIGLAKSIASLEGSVDVAAAHLEEAYHYCPRPLQTYQRTPWSQI